MPRKGEVRRREILDGSRIRPGDMLIGLPSLGLHTNGYSLARRVLLEKAKLGLKRRIPELGRTLGDELLAPHRCYWPVLKRLLDMRLIRGLVHITGGGLTDNTPRILPRGCRAQIRLGTWPVLPVFSLIERLGRVPAEDMLRTFNMGIGMVLVVGVEQVKQVISMLDRDREKYWPLGRIVRGKAGVEYV